MTEWQDMTPREIHWHNYRIMRRAMTGADADGRRSIRLMHKVGFIAYPILLITLALNGDEWALRMMAHNKETVH